MRHTLLAALLGSLALAAPARGQYYPPPGYPQTAQDLVTSWYEHFLGRGPDLYAAAWVGSIQAGESPEDVLASILASDEFYRRAGGTPAGFVQTLFQDLTGQPPSPQQLDHWVRRLYASSRADTAHALLTRFPQSWQGGAPDSYNPEPSPPAYTPPQPGYYGRYRNYYYQRPHYRYRQ